MFSMFLVEELSELIERIHEMGSCDCADCTATKNPNAQTLPAVAIVPEIAGYHT